VLAISDQYINLFLGTPFAKNGRNVSGMDCWGLIMAWYRVTKGISLCNFDFKDTKLSESDLKELLPKIGFKDSGTELSFIKPNDVIAIYGKMGMRWHMGVYVGNSYVLNARMGKGVILESLHDFILDKKYFIARYYGS
jgi:cell wall-associated NlpC family hydrolase